MRGTDRVASKQGRDRHRRGEGDRPRHRGALRERWRPRRRRRHRRGCRQRAPSRRSARMARCASCAATSATRRTSRISSPRRSRPGARSTCSSTMPASCTRADFLDVTRGGFRPRAARQPEGHVPRRPGGRAADGGAGEGRRRARRDRQHELGQRRLRDRQPGALFGLEGRHQPAHQGDGAVACAPRHPRQRHRPGLDHDRHAGRGERPTRRRGTASCRARRSAGSASPRRSPRSPPSSPPTRRATSPARPSMPTAAGCR